MSKSRHIICLVGKTCSGKDTIANYITSHWGIRQICSYTTRPMRDYEMYGVQHKFISKERMARLVASGTVIAYTKSEETGVEYCALDCCLTDDTMLYIINPKGIAYLRENRPDVKLTTIYVDAPEEMLQQRGIDRGDDAEVFARRLASESKEFDTFLESGNADYVVYTDSTTVEVFKQVGDIMEVVYAPKPE